MANKLRLQSNASVIGIASVYPRPYHEVEHVLELEHVLIPLIPVPVTLPALALRPGSSQAEEGLGNRIR